MKKVILFVMAMALMMPVAVNAQSKELSKLYKKEVKKKIKDFDKEGWKLFGSSRSLEVALMKHYQKLDDLGDNGAEIIGVASQFKSKNVGKQMATNNACNQYARNCGSHVKGRVVSDMKGDAINADGEMDKFYAAYEAQVEKEIKGEMHESFSVIRDLGNNMFEMQTFFIIDQDAAAQARIRASENAIKESAAAQKYASKVSEFIREGFDNE